MSNPETETTHAPLPKPPRTWLTMLVGGVLLVSGMVIGSGVTVMALQDRLQRPAGPPERFNERILERLRADLDLTPEQEGEIRKIFQENNERYRTIYKEVRKNVDQELQSVRTRVESVLTPEQAKIWNEKFHKLKNRSFHGGPDWGDRRRYDSDRDWRRDGPGPGSREHFRDGEPPSPGGEHGGPPPPPPGDGPLGDGPPGDGPRIP